MSPGETLLAVRGLGVAYGGIRAVRDVSFDVRRGEVVTLIGGNGAGKSSILRAISGLVPRAGTVTYEGRDLARVPAHAIVGLGVAHVPEGRGIFGNLTVAENLRLATWQRRFGGRHSPPLPPTPRLESGESHFSPSPSREKGGVDTGHPCPARGKDSLETAHPSPSREKDGVETAHPSPSRGEGRVGVEIATDLERVFSIFPRLKERLRQPGGTLSGGEQQMLAVGRALMCRPRLLLLDEPSMGLAPLLVREIFKVLGAINAAGTTVLLVEQNAKAALNLADRGYVLETGKMILEGVASELLENREVQRAYLGKEKKEIWER